MVTLLDLLYVALFAVALPLWGYLVSSPAFDRQLQADPARARKRLWIGAIGYPWALVAVGAALWIANNRSWTSLGLSVPDGWRLWVSVGLVLLLVVYNVYSAAAVARDPEARASVRKQFFGKLADVMPHTRSELYWFEGSALTAGFCEEFLYRGYLIGPWRRGLAGGARRRCPLHSSRAGMLIRDGTASSARGSSARSSRWWWRFSTPFGRRWRCTPS